MKLKAIKNRVLLKVLIIVGLCVVVGVLAYASNIISKERTSLTQITNELIASCAGEDSKLNCYDEKIPKLLDRLSMPEAFEVIKLIQAKDGGYWFCHTAAHNLSETEYAKNERTWSDVVAQCPVGMCSNGCMHGVIQKHFGYDAPTKSELGSLMPIYETICEKRENWDPTEQQRASCYHELGHLSFFITEGGLVAAANICDELTSKPTKKQYLQTCYEGITMSVFQPLEPDDFALVYPLISNKGKLTSCEQYTGEKKGICWRSAWQGNIKKFCNRFSTDLKYACFREGWVTVGQEIQTPKGIVDYCSYSQDPAELRKCYNKIYYGLVSSFNFDEEIMENLCKSMPKTLSPQCFANTASRLIETDQSLAGRSVAVCKSAEFNTDAEPCYKELLYYANFIFEPNSNEFKVFCSILPQKWSEQCLKKNY